MTEAYYQLLYDVLRSYNRCTPSKILRLRQEQVFVFGTDSKGSQRFGAAGLAAKNFGAQIGVTNGRTGDSYALPTMGYSLAELGAAILKFEQYARENRGITFLVTPIGCGHAGFKEEEVAPYFRGCIALTNVMLPEQFIRFFRMECIDKLGLKNTRTSTDESDDEVYMLYDESVHPIIDYLKAHSIPFSQEGGFTLLDDQEHVLAEGELGIESEKVVFLPFSPESEKAFKDAGYTRCNVTDYLNSNR